LTVYRYGAFRRSTDQYEKHQFLSCAEELGDVETFFVIIGRQIVVMLLRSAAQLGRCLLFAASFAQTLPRLRRRRSKFCTRFCHFLAIAWLCCLSVFCNVFQPLFSADSPSDYLYWIASRKHHALHVDIRFLHILFCAMIGLH